MTIDEVADAYVRALETADVELFASLLAPGATAWRNVDDRELDLKRMLPNLGKMHERFADLRFELIERFPIPGGILLRQVLRATLRATGEPYASHRCKLIRITDGKITRLDEYVDASPI